MKSRDLSEELKRLPIPEPDAMARSRALAYALIALKNREAAPSPARERSTGRLLWSVCCALAAILLFYASTAYWSGPPSRAIPDLVLLGEMSALFNNRLLGVVERGGEMDVQLSVRDTPVPQQPVRILLRRGHEVVRILSFSGREVCLDLDGRKTCLDVLMTKDGEVMIVGGSFFWDRGNPASLAGYRIEATALLPAS